MIFAKFILKKFLEIIQLQMTFQNFWLYFYTLLKKEKKGQGLNLDQWQCFLEFIKTVGKVFPNDYNVDEACNFR